MNIKKPPSSRPPLYSGPNGRHSWILYILEDLTDYAQAHELPEIAEVLSTSHDRIGLLLQSGDPRES